MKNLKIGKKLIITFGIVIVLYLITIMLSVASSSKTRSQFQDFYDYSYPMSKQTLEMRRGIEMAIKNLSMSMLTENEQDTATYIHEAESEMNGVKEILIFLKQNYRGDTSRIDEALNQLETARDYRDKVQQLAASNKNSEASELFFTAYIPQIQKVQELADIMDKSTDTLADDTFMQSRQVQASTIVLLIVIGIITLMITLILASYLTKSLTVPISEIEAAAVSMANGKLDVSVAYQSGDELGGLAENMRTMTTRISYYMSEISKALIQLADGDLNVNKLDNFLGDFHPVQMSVRKLVESLNDTLGQINQSADQVSASSGQVSSGSQALSQGATEQTSSVEELAAAINEISNQVKETAQNAEHAHIQAD